MRLLPDKKHLGWTPFAWLIYLFFPLLNLWGNPTPLATGLTLAGVVIFLGLYFRGYWADGKELLAIIAAIVLLGVIITPFNWGASAFFIYAAGFLGQVGRPKVGLRYMAVIVAVILVSAWLLDLDSRAWVTAVIFSILIGGVNIHYAEVWRKDARLRMARGEVERLATLAERERIARDLHDLLGHTLSVITLKAQLAARLVGDEPERAAAEMREVETVSRNALSEVRKAVQGYRLASLEAELSRARVALAAAGIEPATEIGEYDLPTARENAAALALREGVTNVLRHARASACTIAWHQEGGTFELTVSDNGRGGARSEGNGLIGMRERVEDLGGEMQRITGHAAGRGTRLTVRLPADDPLEATDAASTAERAVAG